MMKIITNQLVKKIINHKYTHFKISTQTVSYNSRKIVLQTFLFSFVLVSVIMIFLFCKNFNLEYYDDKLKYILVVHEKDMRVTFDHEQAPFLAHKCPVNNCYIAVNTRYFSYDMRKMHAIMFWGASIYKALPKKRYSHQKYIYFNMESPSYYPVCSNQYDRLFNWTMTYKLDSDVPMPYFSISDRNGNIVGPSVNMKWIQNMTEPLEDKLIERFKNKTKLAAWFNSHCSTPSKRENYVKEIQEALKLYNLSIDQYGGCDQLKCPKYERKKCHKMIETNYLFYLAFENSIAEDYVTEKVLIAFDNYAVPIVFGGANYSRFLPPGSYINAREITVNELVRKMVTLMNNLTLYSEYFRWRPYYKFTFHWGWRICKLCEALNSAKYTTVFTYKNFRKWWSPMYRTLCHWSNPYRHY